MKILHCDTATPTPLLHIHGLLQEPKPRSLLLYPGFFVSFARSLSKETSPKSLVYKSSSPQELFTTTQTTMTRNLTPLTTRTEMALMDRTLSVQGKDAEEKGVGEKDMTLDGSSLVASRKSSPLACEVGLFGKKVTLPVS